MKAFKEGNKAHGEATTITAYHSQLPSQQCFQQFRIWSNIGPISTKVSLLHLAAYWGWIDVVTELVSVHGCSIDCKDEDQNIPLHYAASSGHLEVTKYFLERMGSLHVPLHLACHRQLTSSMKAMKPLHLCLYVTMVSNGQHQDSVPYQRGTL